MKKITIYLTILVSMFLMACGGNSEAKKNENESKKPAISVTNTTPINQPTQSVANVTKIDNDDKKVADDKKDADDLRNKKQSVNSNSANVKNRDADDFGKKSDDDKNRNSANNNRKRDDDDDDR